MLHFLEQTAEIAVFGTHAPTTAALWLSVPGAARQERFLRVWNKAFTWTPEYGRVSDQAHDSAMVGWYYVSNVGDAPIVEVDRGNLVRGQLGRLYWAKYFSAPAGLKYDVGTFSKWYDRILSWVRKNGKKLPGDKWSPYFLPEAWSRREEFSWQKVFENQRQAGKR